MPGPHSPPALQSSGPGAASGPGGDHSELLVRIASLEVENQSLKGGEARAWRGGVPARGPCGLTTPPPPRSGAGPAAGHLQAGGPTERAGKERARPPGHGPPDPGERPLRPVSPRARQPGCTGVSTPLLWQHVSPMRQVEPPPSKRAAPAAEDDEDDDIDLFGSDDEEDKEAIKLREERLRQYAEKKAKKPALVAKSSILLDVKPVSGPPCPPLRWVWTGGGGRGGRSPVPQAPDPASPPPCSLVG